MPRPAVSLDDGLWLSRPGSPPLGWYEWSSLRQARYLRGLDRPVPAADDVAPASGRRAIPLAVRFRVLARCAFRCAYCGRGAGNVELHIDHIVPVSRGGSNHESNLCSACVDCNLGKSAALLEGNE